MSANIAERTDALGLNVLTYTNCATPTDAEGRSYWIPRDAIGREGRLPILFRAADDIYGFDGWQPFVGGHNGGRYETFVAALAWMESRAWA